MLLTRQDRRYALAARTVFGGSFLFCSSKGNHSATHRRSHHSKVRERLLFAGCPDRRACPARPLYGNTIPTFGMVHPQTRSLASNDGLHLRVGHAESIVAGSARWRNALRQLQCAHCWLIGVSARCMWMGIGQVLVRADAAGVQCISRALGRRSARRTICQTGATLGGKAYFQGCMPDTSARRRRSAFIASRCGSGGCGTRPAVRGSRPCCLPGWYAVVASRSCPAHGSSASVRRVRRHAQPRVAQRPKVRGCANPAASPTCAAAAPGRSRRSWAASPRCPLRPWEGTALIRPSGAFGRKGARP